LSKLVVVFGYEFDKLGFYTSVSISTVLFLAFIIQLVRSRRKWKRLALSASGASSITRGQQQQQQPNGTTTTTTTTSRYTMMLVFGAVIFFYYVIFNLGKILESSKNKPKWTKSFDKDRLSRLVIVFGKYELDETKFYVLVLASIVLLVAFGVQLGIWCRQRKEEALLLVKKKEEEEEEDDHVVEIDRVTGVVLPSSSKLKEKTTLDVIIVGCGPKSVGWFHLMQFLDMPKINVRAIVEPFYMDKTKCPHPPQSFVDLVVMVSEMGIRCVNHVTQLELFQHRRTLCVIAGRTRDNPKLFRECIGMGASHIYLEVPGASSIEQLRDMHSLAATRGVSVYMGYQRLCASYIEKAVSLSRSIPKSHVFLCHNENHPSRELHLVVNRHPEGMIRAMASQELAVLVTRFGVKADDIETFKVNTNRLFSERQIFYDASSGKEHSDISRAAFKITTKHGRRSVSVMADRCGGLVSFAVVKSHTGKELQRYQSHSEDEASVAQNELREDNEIMHQFIIEREEYLELKKRVVKEILSGNDNNKALGLVSIEEGIEVMALADYCTVKINDVLEVDS